MTWWEKLQWTLNWKLSSIFAIKVSLDKALEVYKARFANPADFMFFFVGNVDPADKDFQAQVCTWLGGLKTCKKQEKAADDKIRAALGIQKNYFTRQMETKT